MLIRKSCLTERWCFTADNSVISVACTPNCSFIAAATVGRCLYLIDSDGKEIWQKSGDELDHEAWSVAIAADASVIAVGTACKNPADGTVYIYNDKGHQVFSKTFGAPIWSLSFSPSGDVLVVSAWNGCAYKFVRIRDGYTQEATYKSGSDKGLYGIALSRDGSRTLVCAYDDAVLELDPFFKLVRRFPSNTGLYNIAISNDSNDVVAGTRDGTIAHIHRNEISHKKIGDISRPICGVAISQRGSAFVCGSFDGKAYLVSEAGRPVAKFETNGEVWSVACSDDIAQLCVASGDHTIRLIDNACNVAALEEIMACEQAISNKSGDIENAINRLVRLYREYGLYEYGFDRLSEFQQQNDYPNHFQKPIEELLATALTANSHNYWAHFQLGTHHQKQKHHDRAIDHFQKASVHPDYTSKALSLCADSFRAKRLPAATSACYRRAREQQGIGNDAKHVLFNLGRSYEDTKQWAQAISHYQLLASWDISYRNTWQRLESLLSIYGATDHQGTQDREDYTGLTISLLGPDAPRDVDTILNRVLQARTAEVLIKPGERQNVAQIIQKLRTNENYCRGITGTGLDYSQQLFLKYDYSLPEDETKKFLETVNLMYLWGDRPLTCTLDIGSATGRYPTLMTWLGAQACGIDIEPNAIDYAKKLVPQGEEWPRYDVADARNLPFEPSQFGLVTCMMGTFSHIPKEDQGSVIKAIHRTLKPQGCVAISTWDLECEHLAYLSIYNEKQKDVIRANSPSTEEISNLLTSAGFSDVIVRPFCLLPQVVVYDLGTENLRAGDIQLIAQADLAVRSLYPSKHGEMYLAFGVKA